MAPTPSQTKPSPLDLESWREDMSGRVRLSPLWGRNKLGYGTASPENSERWGSASTALLIRRAAAILVESSATKPPAKGTTMAKKGKGKGKGC